MDYQLRPTKAKQRTSDSTWSTLLEAHADALRRYRDTGEGAPDGDVDGVLRELAQIEKLALTQPAPDVDALKFKLRLWADGRVDGYEQEWRVFVQDFERLLRERDGAD